MTYREMVKEIVNDDTLDMNEDTLMKLVKIAYYMGREEAAKECCLTAKDIFEKQLKAADNCRYHNMATKVQGDVHQVYHPDYAGDYTSCFGSDPTKWCLDTLSALSKLGFMKR